MRATTNAHGTTIEQLDVEECLRLLESYAVKLGRLGFLTDDGPVILPVNYRLHRGAIVFTTDPGSAMRAVCDHQELAFEVDDVNVAWREGWSVLVQGKARQVLEPEELESIHATGLEAWAGRDAHTIELIPRRVSGRRLT